MKNIIICGSSRAGKSTLARRLNEKFNYFAIGVDKIAATFGRAYPQLDIRLNWNYDKTTANIALFLGHFLGVFSTNHRFEDEQNLQVDFFKGNNFVLEGMYFDFEKILHILKMYGIKELKDCFILIGLVQNKKTADEFFNDLKKYDTKDDWTYGLNDDDLLSIAKDAVSESQYMSDYLAKYGFTIYDTSTEREQVFDRIFDKIILGV